MERDIAAIMKRVDELGGALGAIECRYVQRTISEGAARRQRAYERKERVSVGMNLFLFDGEARAQTFRIDPEVERQQVERVRELRRGRDGARVHETLAEVAACAQAGRNTVPALIDAVKAYVTVGEICTALKETAYGEYEPDTSF